MTDILPAISNFLSASWRAGAALFLAGGAVYLSELYDVPPLSELDPQLYQGAVLLGVLGLAFLIVHVAVLLGQAIGILAPKIYRLIMAPSVKRREQRLAIETAERERELCLKNWEAVSDHDLRCLLWIKEKGQQRFKARPYSDLRSLYNAHLLERDKSGREEHAREVHWIVPDVIWSKLEDRKFKHIRPPKDPPWERSPYG